MKLTEDELRGFLEGAKEARRKLRQTFDENRWGALRWEITKLENVLDGRGISEEEAWKLVRRITIC